MIPPPAPPSSARRKITASSEITYPPRANLPWAGFVGNRLPAEQTDEGRDAVSFLSVGAAACPDALEFYTQKQRSERLPLEGKLAQRQLRLMRSKLSIFTMGWYDAVTFDLIRHAKRRDTFPSRGRLFLCPGGLCGDLLRSGIAAWRAGHAPPLPCPTGGFALFLKKSPSATGKIPWPMALKRKR